MGTPLDASSTVVRGTTSGKSLSFGFYSLHSWPCGSSFSFVSVQHCVDVGVIEAQGSVLLVVFADASLKRLWHHLRPSHLVTPRTRSLEMEMKLLRLLRMILILNINRIVASFVCANLKMVII